MKIWKYTLDTTDRQTIEMPEGAKILTVQTQSEYGQLWVLVDETIEFRERRTFAIHGTGNPISQGALGIYIGTYQLKSGALVFHVFEVPQ